MDASQIKTLPAHAVILAAGKGTRMKSELPKVLHPLGGAPLILHVLASAVTAGIKGITSVVGYGREQVERAVREWANGVTGVDFSFSHQIEQHGTGHAVMVAEEQAKGRSPWVFVLLGDVPLLKSETIIAAHQLAETEDADAVVITAELASPTGYGRILRNSDGEVVAIREEKDATAEEKAVREINTGIFVFRDEVLWPNLRSLNNNNAQGEYYLTDMVATLVGQKRRVLAYTGDDALEFSGVNSLEQLAALEQMFSRRKKT